jgi:hypothetical protein
LSETDILEKEKAVQDDSSQEHPDESSHQAEEEANALGRGFKSSGDTSQKKRFWTKRKKQGAGITGLLVGGGLFGISLLQAPLQLLQLDFSLGKGEKSQHLVINNRLKKIFYRSVLQRSPDTRLESGRTRIGAVSNRAFGGILDRLESEQGIKFTGQNGTYSGRPRLLSMSNLRGSPLLVPGDASATRLNIAKEFGIDPANVEVTDSAASADIKLQSLSASQMDGVIDGLARTTGGGKFTSMLNPKITKAINKRMWRKVLNLPSLFNPIDRVSSSAGAKVDNYLADRRARKNDNADRTRRSSKTKQRITSARESIASKAKPGVLSVGAAGVALHGAMCAIKDLADILPGVFYATTVMPSMIRSLQFQSTASQVNSGDNLSVEQLGDTLADLKDPNGNTVWQAKSLDSLSSGGAGEGQDIGLDAKLAFATQGGSISALKGAISGEVTESEGKTKTDTFAGAICSRVGKAISLVGGAGIAVVAFAGCGVTAGASCATQAIKSVSQAALSMAIFGYASKIVGGFIADRAEGQLADACGVEITPDIENTEDDVEVRDAIAFGNCLAHASRMENKVSGASMGLVPISSADELALSQRVEQSEINDFKQENLATRLFDINEERSLITTVFRDTTQLNIDYGNISNVATAMAQIPRMISSTFTSIFSGVAWAEEAPYDWGFETAGLPLDILDDPKYDDPLENANWIADNFESVKDYSSKIGRDKDRIKNCFGVKLVDGTEGIKTEILDDEINPLSEGYNEADCGDLSGEAWIRTVLFILDDSTSRAIDCYDGNTSACVEVGLVE